MAGQVGTSVRRKEDPALLSGRGRYADDLPIAVGTLYAHVIRSPHPHADIVRIDAAKALAHDGVWVVITGEDVRKLSDPFLAPVKTPVYQWSLAVERVRYVGEPVALVVAESRYIAEDAAELVSVDYAPLAAVIDPLEACDKSAPLLHPEAKTNEISVRHFTYGDPKSAFARADRRIAMTVPFHRLSFTPMECYVVVAQYTPAEDSYDVTREFPGPVQHASGDGAGAARAGAEMRLRIPPRLRRQFWHQALRLPLCRADGARRAHHRPAGEMGRGPHRASRRRELGPEPRHPRSRLRSATMAASPRSSSTSSRTTARSCARRCRARSTACTAR